MKNEEQEIDGRKTSARVPNKKIGCYCRHYLVVMVFIGERINTRQI